MQHHEAEVVPGPDYELTTTWLGKGTDAAVETARRRGGACLGSPRDSLAFRVSALLLQLLFYGIRLPLSRHCTCLDKRVQCRAVFTYVWPRGAPSSAHEAGFPPTWTWTPPPPSPLSPGRQDCDDLEHLLGTADIAQASLPVAVI